MRKTTIILLSCLFFPLGANTILYDQAEKTQNFLEKTLDKITSSWHMMKYHFEIGNKRLKESADLEAQKIQQKIQQK